MDRQVPKAIAQLSGKPMITRLLENLGKDLWPQSTIVVGHKADMVERGLGKHYRYAYQDEQQGTGHAVLQAREHVPDEYNQTVILYGDHPFVSRSTVERLVAAHKDSDGPLTMATVKLPNFKDWREGFRRFGRIVRNEKGEVERIVEFHDAMEHERDIKEVNPAYFCVSLPWLWHALSQVNKDNAQGEYYLTDIVQIARDDEHDITTIPIEAKEALGANTQEELKILEKLLREQE